MPQLPQRGGTAPVGRRHSAHQRVSAGHHWKSRTTNKIKNPFHSQLLPHSLTGNVSHCVHLSSMCVCSFVTSVPERERADTPVLSGAPQAAPEHVLHPGSTADLRSVSDSRAAPGPPHRRPADSFHQRGTDPIPTAGQTVWEEMGTGAETFLHCLLSLIFTLWAKIQERLIPTISSFEKCEHKRA